jgi:hypothetical protein
MWVPTERKMQGFMFPDVASLGRTVSWWLPVPLSSFVLKKHQSISWEVLLYLTARLDTFTHCFLLKCGMGFELSTLHFIDRWSTTYRQVIYHFSPQVSYVQTVCISVPFFPTTFFSFSFCYFSSLLFHWAVMGLALMYCFSPSAPQRTFGVCLASLFSPFKKIIYF